MTAKERILERMQQVCIPLAIHEFGLIGISENGIGTRLPELAREGMVTGSKRPGKPFKEWSLVANQEMPPRA